MQLSLVDSYAFYHKVEVLYHYTKAFKDLAYEIMLEHASLISITLKKISRACVQHYMVYNILQSVILSFAHALING